MTETSRHPTAWSKLAYAATEMLKSTAYGDRDSRLRQLASECGVSAQTLRKNMAALSFLRKLEAANPTLAAQLAAAPVAAVEHVARWHRRDPVGALEAARQLADGSHSVRSLERAEKASRRSTSAGLLGGARGRSLEHDFRQRLMAAVKDGLSKERRGHIQHRLPDCSFPIDFSFSISVDDDEETATIDRRFHVLIVGPYRATSHYRDKATDWCLRAVALNRLLRGRVIMFVPNCDMSQDYEGTLIGWDIGERGIDIHVAAAHMDDSLDRLWKAVRMAADDAIRSEREDSEEWIAAPSR